MAKVFLDANYFIDVVERDRTIDFSKFLNHSLFVSPLSVHILCYVYRYKVPQESLRHLGKYFILVAFDEVVTQRAIVGPTKDFEDNVQLHSAAEASCDFFLTRDERLRKLKFFGKTQIVSLL